MKKRFLYLLPMVLVWALVGLTSPNHEITIFLAGDSTLADKPYKNGNPEKGWGQIMPLYFKKGVRIENHAVNGRSTKSFIDEGRWDSLMSKVKPGDYVLIEFGHNDAKSEDPKRYAAAETDYTNNLKRFVNDVRQKGAIPVLATPIVRRRFNDEGLFYDTHGQYPDAVRKVAKETNTALFDLHQTTRQLLEQLGPEKSKLLYLHFDTAEYRHLEKPIADDTHLSAYGAFRVCDMVAAQIREKIPTLGKYLKD